MSEDSSNQAAFARRYVLDTHAETVELVLACADSVAETWNGPATTDPQKIAGLLRDELEAAGAWGNLPAVLAGAMQAAGGSLSATPVAAPPYVTATSRGPMLRATVSEGRLVILLHVFEIARDPTRYVRGPATPDESVYATFK